MVTNDIIRFEQLGRDILTTNHNCPKILSGPFYHPSKTAVWKANSVDPDQTQHSVCLFVCVEVLRPSQPNGVMSSTVSLPNHTFTGQA